MERRYWVVKANPRTNDLSFMRRGAPSSWWTKKPTTLQPGDRVFMWASSPDLRVEGLAVVTRPAKRRGSEYVFGLQHLTRKLEHPVGIDDCRRLPKVRVASFTKAGPMGTVLSLKPEQAEVLLARIRDLNDGLDRMWTDLQTPNATNLARARRGRGALPQSEVEEMRLLARELAGVRKTTREQLVLARLGQGRFRADLLRYWGGCAVTGSRVREVLRASHIKPWRSANRMERLSASNGLLLVANLDALFDAGLVSFDAKGRMLISERMSKSKRMELGLRSGMQLRKVRKAHQPFLEWHRKHVFRR